ncbi:MAG: hypothetical protein JWM80_6149 [Cyanobacteria bacterium RYN_339]|nr:hypothetical protein [Cyanobacteria bacterium RYN_339]
MTSVNRSTPAPSLPSLPTAGAQAGAEVAQPVVEAAQPAQEHALAPAQLGALDEMMQGFLADNKLDGAELVAYQAARAAFAGGWDNVPAPADDAPAAAPASPAGGAAQQPGAGLAGAIEGYRQAIIARDKETASVINEVLAGLTSGRSGPVQFLPGMMDPHGIQLLAWAALDREPTEDEIHQAKALLAADAGGGAAKVADFFLGKAPDRAAAAARLVWPASFPQDDTPEARAQREAFNEAMRRGLQGAPTPAPAAPAAPAGPAAEGNKADVAMVGPYAFSWAGRPYAGLLGGWDNAALGKTYSVADALDQTGGYNDLHYYPECPDPGYKAIWELMLAANTGDKAAWTELAQLQLEGYDVEDFLERRSYYVYDPVAYQVHHTPENEKINARLAERVQASRDRWKAGGTEVVLAGDPQLAAKTQAKLAVAKKEQEALNAIAAGRAP